MYPFPNGRREPVPPFGQPTPSMGEEVAPGEVAVPTPPAPAGPWERRQPQVDRRSVLPVEWFRRMPGGATTYAPPGADRIDDSAVEQPAASPDEHHSGTGQ